MSSPEQLLSHIPQTGEGLFQLESKPSLPGDWQIVGVVEAFKFKAKSDDQELFVKGFSPVCGGFIERYVEALKALTQVNDRLNIPVLPMVQSQNGILVFPLGVVEAKYDFAFDEESAYLVDTILHQRRLERSRLGEGVARWNDSLFVIDPIEDNADTIMDYLDR